MDKGWIPRVAVVLVSMIFIGEALTYSSGVNRYDSSAERNGDSVDYSLSSNGTNDYSALLIENHGFKRVDRLVIYLDEDYIGNYGWAESLVPVAPIDAPYNAEQTERSLKLRSFDNVTVCNRQGLVDYIQETGVDPKGCGILSLSYSLPGEIYSGDAHDPLMEWIGNGGSLYWVGSIPGSLYYGEGGLTVVENAQELFFGCSDCINTDEALTPDTMEDRFTRSMCLLGYELYLGVDTSKLPVGRGFRAMGCMKDTTYAYALVQYGDGMIVQSAAVKFRIEQFEDISQIIASGTCYRSDVAGYDEGKVTRNTVRGSFATADGDVIYLFIGRAYTVYGRTYDV